MSIPSLAPYLPLEALLSEASTLGHPQIYGRSAEGRDLIAVSCGDGPEQSSPECIRGARPRGEQPVCLVTAGIHGNEFIAVRTALEVLRAGPLPGATLVVCPVLNPDGYAATWASGRGQRSNANGIDLNRNFPLPYSARPSRLLSALGAGSQRLGEGTYRGTAPLSEPETRALAALVTDLAPHASANLHSFLGTLFCARVWHPSDWLGYSRLARAFRAGQGRGLGYPRLGTPLFDVFTGELEDWQHHTQRCWAVCVECFSLRESLAQHWTAPSPFWRFNPRDPDPIARRDAAGVRAMLSASLHLERPPARSGAAEVRSSW